VLELICEGLADKEIAGRLTLSPSTVRNHVATLYSKLDVHSRGAAIVWAHERGFSGAKGRRTSRK
jgi:DNA-binding NarL/FixJ family response regulator